MYIYIVCTCITITICSRCTWIACSTCIAISVCSTCTWITCSTCIAISVCSTCITISICSTCTCSMYTCVTICVYVLRLHQIVVFGIRLFSLTNEYPDICLLSEKCCHNSFLVKYQMLAHHFAVTNCYTCLYQQPKRFNKLANYLGGCEAK